MLTKSEIKTKLLSKKKILILGASSDIGVELIKVLRSKKNGKYMPTVIAT